MWIEKCLVPVLIAGQLVILDNASFHKSPKIRQAIEAAGANLLFLPAYSPDLNKIEHQWAALKAGLRKCKYQQQNFLKNIDQQLIKMGKYNVT